MGYLLFVVASLILLGAFVVLTRFELARGSRVFSQTRAQLDKTVTQAIFVLAHVDFAAFVKSELRRMLKILGHQVAHLSLQAVRTIERVLTRVVRQLRSTQTEPMPARENTREFVKTLSDFKDQLRSAHPPIDAFEV